RRELVGFGRDGVAHNLTALNWSFPGDISRDGDTVLFYEQLRMPPGIYVRKIDGSPAVRLADGEGYGISPDGKWVIGIKPPDRRTLHVIPMGAGEPRSIDLGDFEFGWGNWFPDGQRILVSGNERGHGSRLFVVDVAGGAPRAISPEGVG